MGRRDTAVMEVESHTGAGGGEGEGGGREGEGKDGDGATGGCEGGVLGLAGPRLRWRRM